MKPQQKRRPMFVPPVERVPDIYDLWRASLAASRVEAARGGQARTDAEHATAAAKGNADA